MLLRILLLTADLEDLQILDIDSLYLLSVSVQPNVQEKHTRFDNETPSFSLPQFDLIRYSHREFVQMYLFRLDIKHTVMTEKRDFRKPCSSIVDED